VVLMHMQGTPGNMQQNPCYADVLGEILAFLTERIAWAESQGIAKKRIIIDPGLGFGKSIAHNLTILKHLERFQSLGCPVLIGHSRKAFIGKILDLEVTERDPATAILSGLCALKGAAIIRVHDVAATVQAVRLAEAVRNAPDR
jgi:dihydropteroate synthase